MKTLLLLTVALNPCIVMAENCKTIADDTARLDCWDKLAVVEEAPPPTVRDPKSWPFGANTGPISPGPAMPKWHVRDKLNAPYEDGKAISVSLTNSGGDRVLKANAAFIYELGANMFRSSTDCADRFFDWTESKLNRLLLSVAALKKSMWSDYGKHGLQRMASNQGHLCQTLLFCV